MTYVIDDERFGARTEFASLEEIRAAARGLAADWDRDPEELAAEMMAVATVSVSPVAATISPVAATII